MNCADCGVDLETKTVRVYVRRLDKWFCKDCYFERLEERHQERVVTVIYEGPRFD